MSSTRTHPRRSAAAYVLFAVSGLAGLVFEMVFLRQLAWLTGNSTVATSLVLAAFMTGLALGAALVGPVADRTAYPLRLYGVLELGVAVTGLAVAWLLGAGREVLVAPLRALPPGVLRHGVEFGGAFLLLLIPTVCMGGTLPALGRFVVRDLSRLTGRIGLLYGVNTMGASAGVFLTGFYLFEWVGVSASAYLAAAGLAVVGVLAVLLDPGPGSPVTERATDDPRSTGPLDVGGVRAAGLAAAAIGGFAVLGYEVAWTRLLSLFVRSFSYSFSLMLSLFLLGLCLGSLALAVVGNRLRDPVRTLAWILVTMGLWVATTLFWLPGQLAPVGASSFAGFLAAAALRAGLVVLPPTILSGMALPLAARIFAGRAGRVGRDLGVIYAWNTAGAIAGALLAGLVLLPLLGAPRSLAVLATLNAAAGVVVLSRTRSGFRRIAVASVLTAVCLLPLLRGDRGFVEAFLQASVGSASIGELLFFHEGATDTVAIVTKEYGFHDPTAKSLITNGIAMSATVKPIRRYMAAEGHLPVLIARTPERGLAVGVGTGITLAAMVSHPELREITAVELSEGVVRGLDHFRDENDGAHHDPRVTLVREDGRHWLELSGETFDVITVEPPPPIIAGSVHLYSYDFYQLCRRRLNPGGVVAQWLPLHAQSLASAKMTARTFVDAVPYALLFLPSVRDAVLIGSDAPLRLDVDRLRSALADPGTAANLRAAYLETPETLLGTFLFGRAGIEAWAEDAPRITDERPRMEFFRNQGGNMGDPDIAGLLAIEQGDWSWVDGLDADTAARIRQENRALRLYVRGTALDDAAAARASVSLSRGTEFHRYRFGCASDQLEWLRAHRPPDEAAGQAGRCRQLLSEGPGD